MPGRPATGHGPVRSIRVSDEIWDAYLEAAGDQHPAVLKQFLAWYARRPGVKRPNRPPESSAP